MKRLSLLSRSGMGIPHALYTLSNERRRGGTKEALREIAQSIEGGSTLAHALPHYPGLFTSFSVEVVRVGEETGTLADNLTYLASELEKQARFRGKLAGALVYPVLLAVLTLLIASGLVLFVFPKVLPLFSDLGAALPLPTRIMLQVSAYLSRWGMVTGIAAIIIAIAVSVWVRYSIILQRIRSRLALRTPVLGSILASYRLSTFSRSLGLLLSSGMALPEALMGAGQAIGHAQYASASQDIAEHIAHGEDIRFAFNEYRNIFPGLVVDILSAGEASGGLIDASFHVANYYENEFEEATRRLSVLIEPVLMIFMGLIVGFVAISIILPIYSITDHLHAK